MGVSGLLRVGWICCALGWVPQIARADWTLHILHTNDIHSRLEPITQSGTTCPEGASADCFGGAARLATKVAQLRAELGTKNQPVIYLDAGDQAQGSLLYTTYDGAAEGQVLEMIGPDAMALGNHEFDHGPEGLATFLDEVSFPVISGNTDVSVTPLLNGRVGRSLILDVAGERVGIVSALAPDTKTSASPGPDVVFDDVDASLRAQIADLRAQGVTKIIALTHIGYDQDQKIAKIDGIDVVVGGHSHTYLSASDPQAMGPYPTWVDDVPVVTAYAYGKYLGHLAVTFSDTGEVVTAQGDVILLDDTIAMDPVVAAKVEALAAPLSEIKSRVVGTTLAPIDGGRESCRQQECAMGNLVADAMLARTKAQGVQGVLINGGSLRASLGAGQITLGDILSVSPFQNTVSTFTLSGATLRAALENGLSDYDSGGGRFAQVAGIRYRFNPNQPIGARVTSAEINGPDGWQDIENDKEYILASNDYMRRGGNDYTMLLDAKSAYDFGPDLSDVIVDYLADQGPYQPILDGRIAIEN